MGGASTDVSWQKPFGNSAIAQIGGEAQQNQKTNQKALTEGVSWNNPFGGSALGQLGGAVQNAIPNFGVVQGVTKINPPEMGLGQPERKNPNDPKSQGYVKPPVSTNPVVGTASTQQARALEESLRAGKRQELNPNIEYKFNLQQNPISTSPVRRGV